jgi:hypothetical protein
MQMLSEKDRYRMLCLMLLSHNPPDEWWLQLLEHPDLTTVRAQYQRCLNKPARIMENFGVFDNGVFGSGLVAALTALAHQVDCDSNIIWIHEVSEWKMAYCLLELEMDTPILEALYQGGAFDK